MKKIQNRMILLIVVVLVSSITVKTLNYETFHKDREGENALKVIPLNLGDWKGVDVHLEDNIFEILETHSIIHRSYYDGNHSVFLSIVYYAETKVDFHAPEGCLAGQGVEISKSERKITLNTENGPVILNVAQLIRQNDDTRQIVFYFYKAGDFLGSKYIKLRLMLALNKFTENKKSGSLIRVSTPLNIDEKFNDAEQLLTKFIENLYPFLKEL